MDNFNLMTYTDSDLKYYNQLIKEIFSSFTELIKFHIISFDENLKGFITFRNFRNVLEKLEIQIDTEILEYLIYVMKCYDNDDTSYLFDLKYENLFDIIFSDENDNLQNIKINELDIKQPENIKSQKNLIVDNNELNKVVEWIFSE